MPQLHRLVLSLALVASACTAPSTRARFAELSLSATAEPRARVGAPAPDFTLPDLQGRRVRLSDFGGRPVVLEWFNPDCAAVAYAYERGPLATMAERWAREDVVWLSINSTAAGQPGSGVERNQRLCRDFGIRHRVLLDEGGIVGRSFGAETTPHFFVIAGDGTLVYRGALDNAPEGHLLENAPDNYVQNALDSLSSGAPLEVSETRPYGYRVRYAN